MKKPKLTVIEGGLSSPINSKMKFFVSSYVTNTRLMGVLAVYAHWRFDGSPEVCDLHQFFYIDCEEAGLETYKSIVGEDTNEIEMAEQALIGGLGAEKIQLTERQLRGLLCFYENFNMRRGLPLPKNYDEFKFILAPETLLAKEEMKKLMKKICGQLISDYQVINYFLMRCFGRDEDGASYLAKSNVPLNLYSSYVQATFCKNVIDREKDFPDGAVSYMCESLIEVGGQYETVISKVAVKDLRVVDIQRCSNFPVSPQEAAMMLAKPEFVTVYEVLLSDDDMNNNIGELTLNLNAIMSTHESGKLFMAFKQNNDHVSSRVFRLSNDVKGVYFLTDYGQLIIAAYNLSDIRYLENRLKVSMLAPFLIATAKYEFHEPVLFEFIQSEFTDFEEFLDFIRNE